jgi:tRNA G18 (ribose-2'-O)-methylase SpoU
MKGGLKRTASLMRGAKYGAPLGSRTGGVAQQDDAWRRHHPSTTLVLDSIDDEAVVAGPGTLPLRGETLWNAARVAREKKDMRGHSKVFVTGGATAIRRIWHDYGIRPNVVFAPDTEPELPPWCKHPTLPSIVVRTSPVQINRTLLSAERNDGFAAEFPSPMLPPLVDLLNPNTQLKSLLVLHQVRIPSNVGALVRAAVEYGFEGVLLDQCADVFNEKVVRASDGAVASPSCKIFIADAASTPFSVMQQAAMSNRLLPLFAVPSQTAEDVFSAARGFHSANAKHRSPKGDPNLILGPMLVLGSESQGLRQLKKLWTIPVKTVSVAITNAQIDSINVAVAGSILMSHFQPSAEARFCALAARHAELERKLIPETTGDLVK